MPRVEVSSMAGMQGRVDLTPKAYQTLIEQKGYRARWEKATFCPFRSPHNPLEHDITHTGCDGWTYFDPKEIKVLMTGLSKQMSFKEPGRVEPGTAYATTASTNRLGFWDTLTLLDSSMRFMELVRRQTVGVADRTKYELLDALDVRDKDRVYDRDVDWQVVNNQIVWIDGGASPARASIYSISYTFHPVYYVLDLTHDVRDTFVQQPGGFPSNARQDEFTAMPVQAMCRLSFLVRDPGQDAPPTLDNPITTTQDAPVELIPMSESAT